MYAEVYNSIDADTILTICVSSDLSGTFQAARAGRDLVSSHRRIEVMDSRHAAMGEGFVVMRAARAAADGRSLAEVVDIAHDTAEKSSFLCTFQTLEYLKRGGRIGAAQAFLGSLLKINPLISLQDGVVHPAGKTRTRAQAVDRLVSFAAAFKHVEEIGVEHTSCPEEADMLIERLAEVHPGKGILCSGMTPVIGAHTGPGLLLVAVCGV
jgi:DegV family protein with EDD domain